MLTPSAAPSRPPNCLVVIPARLESQRLPRKLLLRDTGKTVIQHTYEAAGRSPWGRQAVVATDSPLIAQEVQRFGGQAELTDPAAASGTDRVAEVARRRPDVDIFVNLQGDEPEVAAEHLDRVVELLAAHPERGMSTLAAPIRDARQLSDTACVKVVTDQGGRALYFSRSPIPHVRDGDPRLEVEGRSRFFRHIGLYAYRRDFLLWMAGLPPAELEMLEKLEQLRVLWAGGDIYVGTVESAGQGIDTADDYRAFVRRQRGR
jgi:3-deoxy-manno-octulosonate cytidylyltransferase (CMP-KDO synthetase)